MELMEFAPVDGPTLLPLEAGDLDRVTTVRLSQFLLYVILFTLSQVFSVNRFGSQDNRQLMARQTGGLGEALHGNERRFQLRRFVENHVHPDSFYNGYQLISFFLEESRCHQCQMISAEVYRACLTGHNLFGRWVILPGAPQLTDVHTID